MSNLFAGVYGAKFPEVVMNSGPLPPEGGLPAPLHDTPDARINYGATLLGDLQPYAYGEAGFMSSQSQNNQPHRIQKIIPELFLPEPNGKDVFRLSHAVDDSDLAFVMRLNRNSIFCTGSRTSTRRNTKIGTTVDPIINLATLNYLLAGLQISRPVEPGDGSSLWWEFLHNLDPSYWPKQGEGGRNYSLETGNITLTEDIKDVIHPFDRSRFSDVVFLNQPFGLDDIVHIVRHCIKPFGVVRGSERQGGQHEMSAGAATWTTSAIATLVIDGKEANVVNIWHHEDIHAGDDLVLRLKLMPVKTYTLNHYFKGFARKSYEVPPRCHVWQLTPDVFSMESVPEYDIGNQEVLNNILLSVGQTDFIYKLCRKKEESEKAGVGEEGLTADENQSLDVFIKTAMALTTLYGPLRYSDNAKKDEKMILNRHNVLFNLFLPDKKYVFPWQEIGFWHIGRCQVMRPKYGEYVFYNDDMANGLKTNHIDMTFQPTFSCFPRLPHFFGLRELKKLQPFTLVGKKASVSKQSWEPRLQLEKMHAGEHEPVVKRAHVIHDNFEPSPSESGGGRATERVGAKERQRSAWDIQMDRLEARLNQPSAWDMQMDRLEARLNQPSAWDMQMDRLEARLNQPSAWDIQKEKLEAQTAPAPVLSSDVELPLPTVFESRLPEPALPAQLRDPLAAAPSPLAVDAAISEASRQELLGGLGAQKKPVRATGKGRKTGDPAAARGPVEGTLLRPGADPEACHMELL